MLKFLGSGSAFNTKLGNTSAYIKRGTYLILIDCGSSIFQRIKDNNVLEGIEHIYVIITHTHADHVGSLADLILYSYYSHGEFAKNKITVLAQYWSEVRNLLLINGCEPLKHFNLIDCEDEEYVDISDISFLFVPSNHVEEIPSYSLVLNIDDKLVYYSSDLFELQEEVIRNIHNYDIMYIDTCKAHYEGNVHLSLINLCKIIPKEYRKKVWCMHLDESFDREEAENLGFNVVRNEFDSNKIHADEFKPLEFKLSE